MANEPGDIILETNDFEVIVCLCPSGRLGLEINAALATFPHEAEEVAWVRDKITEFLVDNGFE